ncbi:hypothetical protein ACHAPX_009776 [Trichoderma viride]
MPPYCRANHSTVLIGGIEAGHLLVHRLTRIFKPNLGPVHKKTALFKQHFIDLATELYAFRAGGGDSETAPESRFHPHNTAKNRSLDEHTARLPDNMLSSYGITVKPRDGVSVLPFWNALKIHQADKGPGTRILSGRTLILLQPIFYLAAKAKQPFNNAPLAILNKQRAATSSLRPRCTVGPVGEVSEAKDANAIESAGLTKNNREMIMVNSALAPYAAL